MSSLDEYELKYEKPRWHRFNTKANRTKLAKTKEQEKQLKKEKQMKTSKIETIKTIVITALVTGIIAFIAGTIYANNIHDQVKNEAANIVRNVKIETQVKPSKQ